MKSRPADCIIQWIGTVDEEHLYISIVTLAELRYGIERIPEGARRRALEAWLVDQLPNRFGARILNMNAKTAAAWGKFMALQQKLGRARNALDAVIAAIAYHHRLSLVTGNIKDFEGFGLTLLNPWQ